MNLEDFNSDKYVAHYTNVHRVLKKILPSNKIRISSVSKVNDPYERDSTWIENEPCFSDEDAIKCSNLLSELKPHIYNYIKLFCVSSYDKKSSNCFDLSLDIYGKPRMWASYGDNCKGLCLIFDKEELSKEFNKIDNVKIYEDKVEYLDFIPLIESSTCFSLYDLKNIKTNSEEMKFNPELLYKAIDKNYLLKFKYFRKHIDWKTENEYRWLVFSRETKDLDINFGNSLKAIVLGVDCNSKYKCLLEYYNIPLFKLSLQYGKYIATKL
ncbi:DUF2971 domain-containing protein [Arcobacter roscoffensis]|uniref:DUF2971 domain-containing protein n=1 Tax=Arcobacter roscoffensis TaxID=2961520 RepID=A0ABY5E5W1_9BACT|nr:DUF2971 domain-containing protein [Arcobacter roscoffensis]UTJ07549.1 DUF2971 domain-containing protein [Arcobacter roscoffensis]